MEEEEVLEDFMDKFKNNRYFTQMSLEELKIVEDIFFRAMEVSMVQ